MATTAPPEPRLARPVADELAQRSEAIADALDAGDVCTAAVRADELNDAVVAAINEGQVPPELQEPLMARANELVNTVNCPQPADDDAETEPGTTTTAPEEPDDGDENGEGGGEGNGEGNGKDKGKDKDKKKDKGDEDASVVTVPPVVP